MSRVDNSLSEAEINALIAAAAHTPPTVGTRVSKSFDTIHQAPSAGVVYGGGNDWTDLTAYYHGTSSTPVKFGMNHGYVDRGSSVCFPVKKNSYYKVGIVDNGSGGGIGLWFVPLV